MIPESALARLLSIVAQLRSVKGCPWTRQQTSASLIPFVLEEAYELADAIRGGDQKQIDDELADLLYQVVLHAEIGSETCQTHFEHIVERCTTKLIRRHPHVFADEPWPGDSERLRWWEKNKRDERKKVGTVESVVDDIPIAMPALCRARKIQQRVASVGFDWETIAPVFAKITEEIAEIQAEIVQGGDVQRVEEEVGDLMFSVVNLARHLKLDAETALETCNRKFIRRFRYIETQLHQQGSSVETATLEHMEQLWCDAKEQLSD